MAQVHPSELPLDDLLRSNRAYQSRVRELEAANHHLRRELQSLARQLPPPCTPHGEHECAHCQAHGHLSGAAPPPNPAKALSVRERQVLRLLTEGSRSPCIAAQLVISVATVEVHRRNIMRKLGLHTVAALTKYAVREGLTSL